MNRFPILNIYRSIMTLVGGLIVLGGFLSGLAIANNRYDGFQFGTFIVVFLGAAFLAFGWLILAEVVKVLLYIEHHLDRIRYIQERGTGAGADESMLSTTALVNNSSTPLGSDVSADLFRNFRRSLINPLIKRLNGGNLARIALFIIILAALLFFAFRSTIYTAQMGGKIAPLLDKQVQIYGWRKIGDANTPWQIGSVQQGSNFDIVKEFPQSTVYCVAFTPPVNFRGEGEGSFNYRVRNAVVIDRGNGREPWDVYLGHAKSEFDARGCSNWSLEGSVNDKR